jgi:hypothetical protein
MEINIISKGASPHNGKTKIADAVGITTDNRFPKRVNLFYKGSPFHQFESF